MSLLLLFFFGGGRGGGVFGWSQTGDLTVGAPVASLPGAWRHRVSAASGYPVSAYCDWVI